MSKEIQAEVAEEYAAEDPLEGQVIGFLEQWPSDRFRMNSLLEHLGRGDAVRDRSITGHLKDLLVRLGCQYRKSVRVGTGTPGRGYIIDREKVPQTGVGTQY